MDSHKISVLNGLWEGNVFREVHTRTCSNLFTLATIQLYAGGWNATSPIHGLRNCPRQSYEMTGNREAGGVVNNSAALPPEKCSSLFTRKAGGWPSTENPSRSGCL